MQLSTNVEAKNLVGTSMSNLTEIAGKINNANAQINYLIGHTKDIYDYAKKCIKDLYATTQYIKNNYALTTTVNANHQALTANHQTLTNTVNANQASTNGNINYLTTRTQEIENYAEKAIEDLRDRTCTNNNNVYALTNTVNANQQALTSDLNQHKEKTQESLKTQEKNFEACDKKIQLQAGQITGIQQRVVDASGSIATLELQSQQAKARGDAVENRVKDIEGQVRGFNQIQADLIETKVRLKVVEQEHAIRFKSLEAEKKQLEDLKQEVLNLSVIQQQFKRTIEENKQESKAKHAKAANQINKVRERIDNGDKAIKSKANAEEVPEQEGDPILRAIIQEKEDAESPELKQDEAKLAALVAAGGSQGDIEKIEWQSQVLARLEESNKLKMESLSHQMHALKQNMQQLEKREEAFKKMDKKDHGRTALKISHLSEEIEESNAKKLKRQSSQVDLKSNKKKTED